MNLFGNLAGRLPELLSSGQKLVGIDVGASAVKIVKGAFNKGRFQVDACVVVPMPLRSMDERGITNGNNVLGTVQAALAAFGARKPAVATGIHGAGVLTKRISLSKQLPKKEIPNQVRWEAEQVFPVDVNSILVDHLILGERANVPDGPPGTPGWDILLIGVRFEEAKTLQEILTSAGCQVRVMDLDSFVVGDLLETALRIPPQEAVAFVDVGATGTRVSVRHKGCVTFIREFYTGGNAFTENIAQALGLGFDDAEALKIGDGGIPQEAHDSLRTALHTWKTELQQCEDVYVMQEAESFISRWIVFGGASFTPGLFETLNDERFGGKVTPLAADQFIVPGNKKIDPAWLAAWAPRLITAAGLCGRKR